MHTHKHTRLSRLWYNLCADISFWSKLFVRLWTKKWGLDSMLDDVEKKDVVDELIERDEGINKALGLPPLDAKNPYRFL